MINNRDQSIDVLRGLALFIMLFANVAPYLIKENHPFFIRIIDSLAAPLFISIAGYSVLLSAQKKGDFLKNFKRGFYVIMMGAFIDLFIWKITPFVGYDVLYLIGFSIVLSYFFKSFNNITLILISLLVAILGFILQSFFYKYHIEDIPLSSNIFNDIFLNFESFLYYGWFPFFPWFSVFLFGYIFNKYEFNIKSNWKNYYSILFVIGFIISTYLIYKQNKIVRDGYSELFYPMDYIFFTFTICFLVLIFVYKSYFSNKIFQFLNILGKHSMFVYIAHCLYIEFLLDFPTLLMNEIIVLRLIVFYLIIFLLVLILIQIKKWEKWPSKSFILRFLFGS